jgi:hypothetical protein
MSGVEESKNAFRTECLQYKIPFWWQDGGSGQHGKIRSFFQVSSRNHETRKRHQKSLSVDDADLNFPLGTAYTITTTVGRDREPFIAGIYAAPGNLRNTTKARDLGKRPDFAMRRPASLGIVS